jgi:hypothetical protein
VNAAVLIANIRALDISRTTQNQIKKITKSNLCLFQEKKTLQLQKISLLWKSVKGNANAIEIKEIKPLYNQSLSQSRIENSCRSK